MDEERKSFKVVQTRTATLFDIKPMVDGDFDLYGVNGSAVMTRQDLLDLADWLRDVARG